ncbi:DUF2061 domain-containing protein [Pseudobacteriovorax antillogorgiicola]|uniref:Uncharacterized membrane protein n=1 Tax=Pseudobacteriovorax antillogorgiicola TaxID=1513793 RepID=A0A1Y6CVM5_9BACT|nr:DUF2061 domain-containing protein [Pseudobacteriovorax antillogorgiicola]TCS44589.1 putative membrane protein [Pseudobacteriovorax antillogorgiicola]SMF78080.1 Uncharacterized membrane protein [Pseudobacteriovorax antillogorgiicola]
MSQETLKRSLLKTCSWRIIATLATGLLVYIFTQDLHAALAVGGLEAIAKMVLYYGHERLWNSVHWGRVYPMPTDQESYVSPEKRNLA